MKLNAAAVLNQIDTVISDWDRLTNVLRSRDSYSATEDQQIEVATAIAETIRRFAPPGSVYRQHLSGVSGIMATGDGLDLHLNLIGVLRSLRTAYERGYLESVQDLVRGELFADFLEQAEYLLQEGYKDAAAVLIGGVLDDHLRNLCSKNGVSIKDARGKPLTGGPPNDALATAGVYNKLEQKNVTAWLDVRNKAAHGKYAEYDKTHVEHLLLGVRSFLSRFLA